MVRMAAHFPSPLDKIHYAYIFIIDEGVNRRESYAETLQR